MRPAPLAFVALLVGAPLLGVRASADDPAADARPAKQMEAKAPAVVVLKLVTKVGEFESASERIATIVDPAGVILSTGLGGMRGGSKMALVSARVVFPGDEKEYDAILGAFDSRLGLAFFQIKDPAGRAIPSVDVNDVGDVSVGDELFGVFRLEDGFDYAPYFGTLKIVGQVQKPRPMWYPATSWPLASPVFTGKGKFAGVMIAQQGVSEGPRGQRSFVLPATAAQAVIAQGVKASAKALEELRAKEKDAAKETTAEGGEAPRKDAPPPAPGMDDGAPGGMDGEGK